MLETFLWVALGLFVIASLGPRNKRPSFLVGAIGWALFTIYWAIEPTYYLGIGDFYNATLTFLTSIFCIFIALLNTKAYLSNVSKKASKKVSKTLYAPKVLKATESLYTITCAAAIGGVFYFSFAEVSTLNTWLIDVVTSQTVWILRSLGVLATFSGKHIFVNRYDIEIILACTGIESMALFAGVIGAVEAPTKRRIKAFMISVPGIYLLNLLRNVFVVVASGYQWFGPVDKSFYIAHHLIAKIGSTVALLVIAYAVLRILPELVDLIADVARMFKNLGGS
ncbi:MAG: archaeosortase A [Methanocellales archaeon]|nr:archaeosortase A [Methanocellales archaeon]